MSRRRHFRMPWQRDRPAAAVEHVLPPVQRHIASFKLGPEAVPRAREAVTEYLPRAGVAPDSAFADAVLPVTSELVVNVLRHAPRTPVTNVGITSAAGQLVVSVSDTEPKLPDLSDEGMGAGLRTVTELAATYGGDVSAEPAVDHHGKVVLVRFSMPPQHGVHQETAQLHRQATR